MKVVDAAVGVVLMVLGIIIMGSMSANASEVCVGSERACEQGTPAWEIPYPGPFEPLTVREWMCGCV